MLLGFGLEQGPHEMGRELPVLPYFSLHSVRAGSLIPGFWVSWVFGFFFKDATSH